ncbi:peroxiredoxin [Mycobacterium sp. GA-1841]|uniref:OsmC family protein n=1 Tax=Mycobacterium sp. GA-1841 TaxID=1834154 RepID=UPI00096E1751|nr:OsmC family protein [Mycobacterium sp. GA-1841]OMC31157.1 peroxiredoxin [Mycobacterium sp. GA-1841]
MANRTHRYEAVVTWTGNTGSGTSGYRDYARDHDVTGVEPGKPVIAGSADPAFRGDPQRWNPEELLVVSLSQCHMLWYLALCARDGITVTAYRDRPSGTMSENAEGSGVFTEVTLRPEVAITDPEQVGEATELHHEAHRMCFIANSVNFPVGAEPTVTAPNGA